MKKGFTVIELLASIAIMALIIIISVPAYEGISNTIKQNSYNSKMSMLTKSTSAYINKYHKDKVFNGTKRDVCYSISYLIEKNVFSPDNETDDGVTDPLNGGDLKGFLVAQYNDTNYEVNVYYSKDLIAFEKEDCEEKFGTIE